MSKGWKTFLFNLAVAVTGVVEQSADVIGNGEDNVGYILLGTGVINMILRSITNTPIFSKA